MLRKNKTLFIGILIGILLTSTTVYAATTILAKDIYFSPSNESWNVLNVEEALDDLYSMKLNNITYINSDRTSYDIPDGIKKAYIVIVRGTSNIPYNISFSGNGIISNNLVLKKNNTDVNLAVYIEVYEVILTGDDGKITLTKSGGSAASQAWSSFVLY